MIVEVNDAGEILVPAEPVQAAPRTRLRADREGDSVVLKPIVEKGRRRDRRLVDSLPILEGQLSDPAMTFRREGIYGPPGSAVFIDTNEHSDLFEFSGTVRARGGCSGRAVRCSVNSSPRPRGPASS
jgi:hypothetical protein